MNTLAANAYISTRTRATLTPEEAEVKRLAYAIKTIASPSADFDTAARSMAALIADIGPCWLVPIPSRTGDLDANTKLAGMIAHHHPGAIVARAIRRSAPIESQCDRHKKKLGPLPVTSHNLTRTSRWLEARPTYLIDNVTTSGTTLKAAHVALGFGTGLVFADANHRSNHTAK